MVDMKRGWKDAEEMVSERTKWNYERAEEIATEETGGGAGESPDEAAKIGDDEKR